MRHATPALVAGLLLSAAEAAWPVVQQAQRAGLPVDLVVQPQPSAGSAPLALAYVGGRFKLVFSLRGNPLAQAQEQRIERSLGAGAEGFRAALALMAAHELFGHCARHVAGQWHAPPEGYVEPLPAGLEGARAAAYAEMRAARREEGYADLAALAWAHEHRRALLPQLHAWLAAERSHDLIEGSEHDTLAWLRGAAAAPQAVAEAWRGVLLQEAGLAASR